MLIEREDLLARLDKLYQLSAINGLGLEPVMAMRDIKALIFQIPEVDASPVVHGKWTTKRTQEHDGEWYCTVCDYEPIVMSDDMKYCPGCGAVMDLEEQCENN